MYVHYKNTFNKNVLRNSKIWDFPCGPVVETLSANAGDVDLIPGLGKILHASEQPSHTLQLPSSRARALQQEKPPQWEAHTPQLGSSFRSLQLEEVHGQQQRPSTTKNK